MRVANVSATTQAAVTGNDFYGYYKDRGFSAELLSGPLPLALLATIGLFGNINIAIATWRTKSLHGTCNYLLAIGGIADSVHQLSHFCFLYVIASGLNFIDHFTCLKALTLSVVGLNFGILMTLFVGVDRLLSVCLPTRHRSLNPYLYIGFFVALSALYSAFFLTHAYIYATTHPKTQVNCIIPDTMPGYIQEMWFTGCIVVNVSTVVSYSLVWVALRLKTGSKNDAMQRVFKSLSVIMFIVVIGWTINAIVRVWLPHSGINPFYFFFVGSYFGIPVNMACASHFFVLYIFSTEYRLALRRQLNSISQFLIRRPLFSEASMRQGVTVSVVPSSQGFVKS